MKLKNYMRNGKRFEISLGIIKRRSENVNAFTKGEEELEELRGQLQAVDESVDSLQEVLLLSSKELEKLEGQRELLKEKSKMQQRIVHNSNS